VRDSRELAPCGVFHGSNQQYDDDVAPVGQHVQRGDDLDPDDHGHAPARQQARLAIL
jgi:hypothetical protein